MSPDSGAEAGVDLGRSIIVGTTGPARIWCAADAEAAACAVNVSWCLKSKGFSRLWVFGACSPCFLVASRALHIRGVFSCLLQCAPVLRFLVDSRGVPVLGTVVVSIEYTHSFAKHHNTQHA